MSPLPLLCALLAIAGGGDGAGNPPSGRGPGKVQLPSGCLYEGRWHGEGAAVRAREPCLQCACVGGALSCRRRACPQPAELPPGCRALHRRGACCPQVHCPDGVQIVPSDVSTEDAELSTEKVFELALPACVEGGTVYAAGSAMSSEVACEQCFCLGGARRCVRPRCLPPPAGCCPRPAPGSCCPQRYYCEHATTSSLAERNSNDCRTAEGGHVEEGERVAAKEGACSQCFCLRGAVRCQRLACAPSLHGCTPLVHPGHCCPHQYRCNHTVQDITHDLRHLENVLQPIKGEERSFHSSKSTKRETTLRTVSSATELSTAPGERPPPTESTETATASDGAESASVTESSRTGGDASTGVDLAATEEATTEGPERTVKVVVNGTVNCTTELSSASILYNFTQPRVPFGEREPTEEHTFPASELITDSEAFVINVTSSLRTNATAPSVAAPPTSSEAAPSASVDTHSFSKKTKGDADYDYDEPTLPPSLPNLKIIPFVAADAVVDEEEAPKESSFPALEGEGEFPVLYPSGVPERFPALPKQGESAYPSIHRVPDVYESQASEGEEPSDFVAATAFGNSRDDRQPETPAANLFSPPVETEGGFVPKHPGSSDDFFAAYRPTALPHLTTSMQLDAKGDCVTGDGQPVPGGESVMLACSACACAWGRLRCAPLPCATPSGCTRRPPLGDECCGRLVCATGNLTKGSESGASTQNSPLASDDTKNDSLGDPVDISITTSTPLEDAGEAGNVPEPETIDKTTSQNMNSTTAGPDTGPTEAKQPESPPQAPAGDKDPPSPEYEDDEDVGGFSLGSVLQLLLSETYATTTAVPFVKMPPSAYPAPAFPKRPPPPSPPPSRFVPSDRYSFLPPERSSTIDRIDHLVLGEASAIGKATPRPPLTRKPPISPTPQPTATKTVEITSKGHTAPSAGAPRPLSAAPAPAAVAGLPKLAGCNIYGRMYRVGKIIAELSTACQECRCTELGVQCAQFAC